MTPQERIKEIEDRWSDRGYLYSEDSDHLWIINRVKRLELALKIISDSYCGSEYYTGNCFPDDAKKALEN